MEQTKNWLMIFGLFIALSTGEARECWGYVDSLGHYKWHSRRRDSVFVDEAGMKWRVWSGDSTRWTAAMTIYRANVKALLSLGYDTALVERQIRLFPDSSVLFDKLSRCLEPEHFVGTWRHALNSADMTFSSRKHPLAGHGGKYAIKWYPYKGGISHANGIGLVKSHLLAHVVEAVRSRCLIWRARVLSAMGKEESAYKASSFNIYLINARDFGTS